MLDFQDPRSGSSKGGSTGLAVFRCSVEAFSRRGTGSALPSKLTGN